MSLIPNTKKWVSKLMGYDYEINYNKGKDNLVVGAPTHLMTTFIFQLFLCLFQIGYNMFNKDMSMTLHYLKSSNGCLVTILLCYHLS